MNKEAMLAVADVIEWADRVDLDVVVDWEDGRLHDNEPTSGELWDNCNTAGCIAGWTAAWADRSLHRTPIATLVAEEFDITVEQADRLCLDFTFWADHLGTNDLRDAKAVARLLRNIVSGKVDL